MPSRPYPRVSYQSTFTKNLKFIAGVGGTLPFRRGKVESGLYRSLTPRRAPWVERLPLLVMFNQVTFGHNFFGETAMCRSSSLVTSCIVVLSVIVCVNFCQGQTGADNNKAEQSIIGPWRADSVTLLTENGIKKILPKNDKQSFSIAISDKNLIMCVDDQKIADMSYDSDATQSPSTIDLEFQDQDLQGIYELNGYKLKISLNDAKKGRPKDFAAKDTDMKLVLHRFDGQTLFLINADGTNLQPIAHMPEYTYCVTPEWSHDGSKIAFDARRSLFGESWQDSHVFTVNVDGTSIKDLGEGAMPSWSRDGTQIAYISFSNGGIWCMNADGTDKHLIDRCGWSPHWSPITDELVYAVPEPGKDNLCVYDLKTKTRRDLLDNRYRHVMWDLCWSPDGQSICFMGRFQDNSSELAIVRPPKGKPKDLKSYCPTKRYPE